MYAGLTYGMNVYGFEIETEYYDLAKKRLENTSREIKTQLF
jgi:DNA modification methylase